MSFLRRRERKVDHFQKYKKRQRDMASKFAGEKPKPKQKAVLSRRYRAKEMRKVKKQYGLTRSQMGAIGAGHMKPPWE